MAGSIGFIDPPIEFQRLELPLQGSAAQGSDEAHALDIGLCLAIHAHFVHVASAADNQQGLQLHDRWTGREQRWRINRRHPPVRRSATGYFAQRKLVAL